MTIRDLILFTFLVQSHCFGEVAPGRKPAPPQHLRAALKHQAIVPQVAHQAVSQLQAAAAKVPVVPQGTPQAVAQPQAAAAKAPALPKVTAQAVQQPYAPGNLLGNPQAVAQPQAAAAKALAVQAVPQPHAPDNLLGTPQAVPQLPAAAAKVSAVPKGAPQAAPPTIKLTIVPKVAPQTQAPVAAKVSAVPKGAPQAAPLTIKLTIVPKVAPQTQAPVAPVPAESSLQELHHAVLGMSPPVATPVHQVVNFAASAAQVQQPVATPQQPAAQPAMQQLTPQQPVASAAAPQAAQQTSATVAKVAANAANEAASAANYAVAAANTAATAAQTANLAANAAAKANTAATTASSPAQRVDAANTAAAAANTATNAAAYASSAANAATNAANVANTATNTATNAANTATKAATNAANVAQKVTYPAAANPAAAATPAVAAPAQAHTAFLPMPVKPLSPSQSWSTPQWYMMNAYALFAGLTFAMVIKAICVAGNVLVQCSPMPSVRKWDLRGDTGEADAAPYVSVAFGGCQWCFYGMFAWWVTARSGFLILVYSNFLGATLGSYYVLTFFRNCKNEDNITGLHKYAFSIAALALLQGCALIILPAERALFLIGIISSFCSFINATSVLVTVPAVIKSKDSRSIPGSYAAANMFSSFVWSICGFILADPCVMMPNIFSTCCSAFSLSLKFIFPSTEDDKLGLEEGKKAPFQAAPAPKKVFRTARDATPMPIKPAATRTPAATFSEHVSRTLNDSAGESIASAGILDSMAESIASAILPTPLAVAAGDGSTGGDEGCSGGTGGC